MNCSTDATGFNLKCRQIMMKQNNILDTSAKVTSRFSVKTEMKFESRPLSGL